MGIGKWITGALGWAVAGPLGALLGYALGSFAEDSFKQQDSTGRRVSGQRNSFILSLLVLSTAVMKADGRVLRSELDFVKDFLRKNFGEQGEKEGVQILKDLYKKEVNIREVSGQIAANMNHSQRLQLLHYLVALAMADGAVNSAELKILRDISAALRIPYNDSESVLAMFDNRIDAAYKVLEIEPSATDDQVKQAYKKMALKHHPDKVSSLGPDVQKAAEERFKAVAQAYEKIKKERGIK